MDVVKKDTSLEARLPEQRRKFRTATVVEDASKSIHPTIKIRFNGRTEICEVSWNDIKLAASTQQDPLRDRGGRLPFSVKPAVPTNQEHIEPIDVDKHSPPVSPPSRPPSRPARLRAPPPRAPYFSKLTFNCEMKSWPMARQIHTDVVPQPHPACHSERTLDPGNPSSSPYSRQPQTEAIKPRNPYQTYDYSSSRPSGPARTPHPQSQYSQASVFQPTPRPRATSPNRAVGQTRHPEMVHGHRENNIQVHPNNAPFSTTRKRKPVPFEYVVTPQPLPKTRRPTTPVLPKQILNAFTLPRHPQIPDADTPIPRRRQLSDDLSFPRRPKAKTDIKPSRPKLQSSQNSANQSRTRSRRSRRGGRPVTIPHNVSVDHDGMTLRQDFYQTILPEGKIAPAFRPHNIFSSPHDESDLQPHTLEWDDCEQLIHSTEPLNLFLTNADDIRRAPRGPTVKARRRKARPKRWTQSRSRIAKLMTEVFERVGSETDNITEYEPINIYAFQFSQVGENAEVTRVYGCACGFVDEPEVHISGKQGSIQCTSCSLWSHLKCLRISRLELKEYQRQDLHVTARKNFVCVECAEDSLGLVKHKSSEDIETNVEPWTTEIAPLVKLFSGLRFDLEEGFGDPENGRIVDRPALQPRPKLCPIEIAKRAENVERLRSGIPKLSIGQTERRLVDGKLEQCQYTDPDKPIS